MPDPLKLFELFPSLQTDWPYDVIPGKDGGGNPVSWLADINEALVLSDLRTNSSADQVSFSCRFEINASPNNEFRIHTMPDVLFKILNTGTSDAAKYGYLFVTTGAGGTEVTVERLPVEIQIPSDIIFGDPKTHKPGQDDSDHINDIPTDIDALLPNFFSDPDFQFTVLRSDLSDQNGSTSVYTRIRLHITPDLDISLTTAAPISFGKCGLFNLPVLAIHDFQLIPSINLIYQEDRKLLDTANWVRHGSYLPDVPTGAFAMRSIEFNTESGYFKQHFPKDTKRDERAEWVFEDFIFPFSQGIIPYHFSVGVRRNIENFNDDTDIFTFANAAFSIPILDLLTVHVYQLYLQTPFTGLSNYRFKLGVTFGKDAPPTQTVEQDTRFETVIELGDNNTFRLGLFFTPGGTTNPPGWNNWKISDKLMIQPVGLTYGFGLDKFQQHESWSDYSEILGSFWIHDNKAKWNPDGTGSVSAEPLPVGGDNLFKTKVPVDTTSPKDKPLSFAITNLGWKQGSPAMESFSFPEGYTLKLGPLPIDLFEMGLLTEDGANYFSVSGGVQLPKSESFDGGIWFKRLRFRVGGSSSADPFKIDGVTVRFEKKNLWLFEAGGYLTDEDVVEENYHKSEFAFSGILQLFTGKKIVLALDFIKGRISPLGDSNNDFSYFMFQILMGGHIPIGSVELLSVRGLYANNMAPNLSNEDLGQGDMKYYNWAKTIDPFQVPGNRRLAAWKPVDGASTMGIGLGVSFVGCGDLLRITALVMLVNNPADHEKGLMIAVEIYYGKPDHTHDNQVQNPLGWGILEYDLLTSNWKLQIGIDLTLKTFVENAPEDLARIFKVKGTLFVAKQPRWQVAIGRIDDQTTWAMFTWDWNLWHLTRTYVMIAFCFEYSEGEVKAIGGAIRMEGGIDAGFFGISYYAGILITWKSMTSGTSEYVFLAQAEIGGTVKLFWVIRFGIDAKVEVRQVGYGPTQTGLEVRIHVSTSWFLPDVNWSYEKTSGDIVPSQRQVVSSPLASAASLHDATSTTISLHTESLAKGLITLDDMDGLAIGEPGRLQRFEQAIYALENPLLPMATDASINIKFSVPVEQSLGIGPVDSDWGTQLAGDDENYLKVRTRLSAISVRRRPRFGINRVWSSLEENNGIQIIDPVTGELIQGEISFQQSNLSYQWNLDVQENARLAPLNLVINSDTPYSYTTENAQGDEDILTENPDWPCCRKETPRLHWYYFRNEPLGVLNRQLRRLFYQANGLELITSDGFIVNRIVTANAAPVAVAAFVINEAKQIMRMVFDEDAFVAGIYVSGDPKRLGSVTLIAENVKGEEVLMKTFQVGQTAWQYLLLSGKSFRSVRVMADDPKRSPWTLFADTATWLAARDYERSVINSKACADQNPNRATDYSGNGGLFFLPNHEYEICLSSEISVMHNTTQWETKSAQEYVYFLTKGLPGLNYTKNVGEEIAPYVQSSYPLRRPFIYAEEPVVLALNEQFKLSLPLAYRRPGDQAEHIQIMNLRLFVNKDLGDKLLSGPDTAVDWITAAAQAQPLVIKGDFRHSFTLARSTNAKKKRLANVRAASASTNCSSVNILDSHQTILTVFPTDITIEGIKYWTPNVACTAKLKLDSDIFIDHPKFADGDIAAFTISGPGANGWSIAEGKLTASGIGNMQIARFGAADWNYCTVRTEITNLDGEAGLVMGVGAADQLYLLVSRGPDGNMLRIYSSYPNELLQQKNMEAADSIQFLMTAYDDQVYLNINGETISIPRGNVRSGYFGMAVQGSASFANLFAEPFTMYQFNFRISQFNSFHDHISDFQLVPNQLAMTAENDFNTARGNLATQLVQVMTNSSADADRESLFVKLVSAGALFTGQNVTKSVLTLLQNPANDCSCLLIESPESLDLSTGELALELARKFTSDQTGPLQNLQGLGSLLQIAKMASSSSPGGTNTLPHPFNEVLFRDRLADLSLESSDRLPGLQEPWSYNRLISSINVARGTNKNSVTIRTEYGSVHGPSINGKNVYYLDYSRQNALLKIYKCTVQSNKKMLGELVNTIALSWVRAWGFPDMRSMRLIIVPSENLVCYGDITNAVSEWRVSTIATIQNVDATKILVMPAAISSAFERGDWKLKFSLNRIRYATLDSADTVANYKGEETLTFSI